MCLQGWRWAWIISGVPGIVLAAVIVITVREPLRTSNDGAVGTHSEDSDAMQHDVSWHRKVAATCQTFFRPSLLVLCIAGSVRNAGENATCRVN